MSITPYLTLVLMVLGQLSLFGQEQAFLRKAQNSIDKGDLKSAMDHYRQLLDKEPNNRNANLGLGLIYSEYLDNYSSAQPFLEKAMQVPVQDSAYDLIFALGKCYHFNGEYDRALSFYKRLKGVKDLEEDSNFEVDIAKRREDCEYAKAHQNDPIDKNIYFANAGKAINTDRPEYVPVLIGKGELLFTSKRQDDPKEELNYLDGKYYESMYVAKINYTGFSDLRRYSLPDQFSSSKMYNHHQAVVSLSQDGKKLFTFKEGKLYEVNIDERLNEEPKKVKIKNFDHYENHAFLTRDGKSLFFTSELDSGFGGTDIYLSQRDSSGNWGLPKNLGEPINTEFDEDAPYLSEDGTLYFASEGLPGYGNYDIYKSRFENGKWTTPINLGAPINTSAHDVFLVTDSIGSVGYFSSGRKGGQGDMDIYKITYLDKFPKDCQPYDAAALYVSATDVDTSDFKNLVKLNMAPNYQVMSVAWTINGRELNNDNLTQEFDYGSTGTFPVKVKVMVGCDTCLNPAVACLEYDNKIEKIAPLPVLASVEKTVAPIVTNPSSIVSLVPVTNDSLQSIASRVTQSLNPLPIDSSNLKIASTPSITVPEPIATAPVTTSQSPEPPAVAEPIASIPTATPQAPEPPAAPEPIASVPAITGQAPETPKTNSLNATPNVSVPDPLVVETPPVPSNPSVTALATQDPIKLTEPKTPSVSTPAVEPMTQTAAASPAPTSSTKEDKPIKTETAVIAPKKITAPKIVFVDLSATELQQMGVTEQKILFDLNKSVLLNTDVEVLKKELELLQANSDLAVNLVGYADARGPVALNRELSLKRAITVKRFLMANGLEQKRILGIKGAGAVDFVNECSAGVECPDEKHMENRRVEIKFVRIVKQP